MIRNRPSSRNITFDGVELSYYTVEKDSTEVCNPLRISMKTVQLRGYSQSESRGGCDAKHGATKRFIYSPNLHHEAKRWHCKGTNQIIQK